MKKKYGTIMLTLLTAVKIFSACEKAEAPLPERTSEEADIYVLGDSICDHNGDIVEGYLLDEQGNLVDADGQIYIVQAKLKAFSWVESVCFGEKQQYSVSLCAMESDGHVYCKPTEIPLEITLTDPRVINRIVTIESTDPGALEIAVDEIEKAPAALRKEDIPTDRMQLCFDESGCAELMLLCRLPGEAELVCRNYLGEEIGRCSFLMETLLYQSDDAETHEHSFTVRVVSPTEKIRGYTLYVCNECGCSYREAFVDRLVCNHIYVERVVPPTYLEKGYTLHSCSVCGDSYRDNETEMLLCRHENMIETVIAPVCTMGGYTIHECVNCRNYRYEDTHTEPLGHQWDNGKITREATCGAKGLKSYSCTRCSATKSEEIPATLQHSYTSLTVSPSCTENGYDVHTCSCGDSYTDHLVPMLGHAELRWEITQQPNCAHTGVRAGTCVRCGCIVSSELLPATGNHCYETTMVEADCEHGAYTKHRCNICGDSYTDNVTPALGHEWIESSEQVVVGMEVHTFCSVCGFDFTAAGGYDPAHGKAHALAGEGAGSYQSAVEKYETLTSYTCARCGARK